MAALSLLGFLLAVWLSAAHALPYCTHANNAGALKVNVTTSNSPETLTLTASTPTPIIQTKRGLNGERIFIVNDWTTPKDRLYVYNGTDYNKGDCVLPKIKACPRDRILFKSAGGPHGVALSKKYDADGIPVNCPVGPGSEENTDYVVLDRTNRKADQDPPRDTTAVYRLTEPLNSYLADPAKPRVTANKGKLAFFCQIVPHPSVGDVKVTAHCEDSYMYLLVDIDLSYCSPTTVQDIPFSEQSIPTCTYVTYSGKDLYVQNKIPGTGDVEHVLTAWTFTKNLKASPDAVDPGYCRYPTIEMSCNDTLTIIDDIEVKTHALAISPLGDAARWPDGTAVCLGNAPVNYTVQAVTPQTWRVTLTAEYLRTYADSAGWVVLYCPVRSHCGIDAADQSNMQLLVKLKTECHQTADRLERSHQSRK